MADEKVLAYDRKIIPQETGWWCGPASLQIALACRGITKSERDCMLLLEKSEGNVRNGQVFDDQDGTDYIGQVTSVLNSLLPGAKYKTVDLQADPPSKAQIDALWNHIVASIDAGVACVFNIDSPPGNRPVAVAPSTQSPNYGWTEIFHYITGTGRRVDGATRKVLIDDPGFSPFSYWMTVEKLASLITPKGYSYAAATVAAPTPAPVTPAPAPAAVKPSFAYLEQLGRSCQSRWGARINLFLLHTQEGNGTARSLAAYCNNPANSASYHYVADDSTLVAIVDTDMASWSVLDANARSINFCFAGSRASMSRAEWLAKYTNAIKIAAWCIVEDAKKYPYIKPSAVNFRPFSLGNVPCVSDHYFVTKVLGIGTHTDCGPNFPSDILAHWILVYLGLKTDGGVTQPAIPVVNKIDECAKANAWLGARETVGEITTPDKVGRFAVFENGAIYWHPETGAYAVPTSLMLAWREYGYETGVLGYPTNKYTALPAGDVQAFKGGVLYRQHGADHGFYVHGLIGARWAREGYEAGALGYPISNEYKADGAQVRQDFEHGSMFFDPSGVVRVNQVTVKASK